MSWRQYLILHRIIHLLLTGADTYRELNIATAPQAKKGFLSQLGKASREII
jgi:hypothetical protein